MGNIYLFKSSPLRNISPLYRKGVWGIGNTHSSNLKLYIRVWFRSVVNVYIWTQKKPNPDVEFGLKRRLPTLPRENRSTIGASELNFSVRNGKRWNLTAITT